MHLIEIVGLPSLLVLGFFEILKSFNSIQKQNKKELFIFCFSAHIHFKDMMWLYSPFDALLHIWLWHYYKWH